LPPAERRLYLDRHAGLVQPAVVARLCELAGGALDNDLERAAEAAEAALWLAGPLGDERSIGLAERTLANTLHAKGDYRAAQLTYERARDRFSQLGDRLQEAITLSSALHNLIYVGGYEQAHQWYESARQIYEGLGDRLRLARLEANFGTVLYRQDLWQKAMSRYERALTEFQAAGQDHDTAICLRNMATCHISLSNTQEALDCYQEAKRLIEEQGLDRLGIENDYNIAYLYYHTADYARAIRLYRRCRQRFEEVGDERHQALCDLDLSEIFLELNMVEEAAELANWAWESFDRLGVRYEAARAVANLGVAISRQGRIFKALEALAQARALFAEEANEVWPAQIDLYEAVLLYREGRSYEASSLAQRSAASFGRLGLPVKTAACELLMARIALDDDQLEEAERLCRSALAHLERHPSSSLHCETLLQLGMVLETGQRRQEALAAYRDARDQAEHLRSHLQTDDLKFGFFSSRLRVYEALVAVALQKVPSDEDHPEVFAAMEKSKARSLADLMAFRAHVLPSKTATRSNLVESIRSLREELNWYYRQIDLRQMTRGEESLDHLDELRRRSHGKERQLARTLDELATTDRELASLQTATVVSLEEIQAALPGDAAIVEYFFARGAVYAAVIGADSVEMLPLTMASRVREQHRMLQFQLSRFQLGPEFAQLHRSSVDSDTRGHLAALFDELISPIWPRLLRYDELVVVPHGFLHHLPFQALFDGTDFMIDRFRMTFAPSASVAHLCRLKQPSGGGSALVVGVPDGASGDSTEPEREARAVAAALPGSRLLLDGDLNAAALERAAHGRRLLHLATRAHYRRDNPMFSALELGGQQLTLFDIYNLELETDLVMLTGCSTGLDTLIGSDALLGLTRGLLYAGARSLVIDLWHNAAEPHRQFLGDFYYLLADRPAVVALREAQLAQRRRHAHPFFWASYCLIGARG
jgi:CHAT domain-containing protein/Tfp pilus assembly protein PilF